MESANATRTVDPFAPFKVSQKEGWAMFAPLEIITMPAAATLVNFAGVRPGDTVLDVACGTGVAAITAARLGAKVTGLDLSPALLDRARRNAAQAEVSIEWHEGDAEALPFADQTFDVVISQFGHMFAPRPAFAIAESLRVLKAGGRIAFSTWPPEVFTGRMMSLVGRHLPLPEGAAPPVQWGEPQTIRERLGDQVHEVTFDRSVLYSVGLSPRQVAARFEETHAPVIRTVAKLKDQPAHLAAFRVDLERLVETYFQDNLVRQDYLMTRAIKR